MRDIKFRAFISRKMQPVNEFDFYGTLGKLRIAVPSSRYMHAPTTLMQYTGLKDKNGVEIYEGDVVKTQARDEAKQVVWNTQRGCYFLHPLGEAVQSEVDVDEFNTATSMSPHWFTQGFYDKYEEDCAVEVIGNIYESPELLKREQ